jgi:hypothetical protein
MNRISQTGLTSITARRTKCKTAGGMAAGGLEIK